MGFFRKQLGGCEYYRGVGVFGELRRYDIDIRAASGSLSWGNLADCDIAFMQGPYNDTHMQLAKLVKRQMPLWIDFDDDLFSVPPTNPAYAAFGSEGVHKNISKLCELADVITVTTQYLADRLSVYRSNIRIIPNAYNDYRMSTKYSSKDNDPPIVLWRGTASHQGDLIMYGGEINALIQNNPNMKFIFQGWSPWMLNLNAENVGVLPEKDLMDYFADLDEIKPDILIVPLVNDIFNMSKSNIAWLEVARYGTKVIAPSSHEWFKPNVYNYTENTFTEAFNLAMMATHKTEKGWNYVLDNLLLSNINTLRLDIVNDYT